MSVWAELDGVPVALDGSEDEEVDHIVCCDDENVALCGIDLTEVEWVAPGTHPDCATCARIEEKDAHCYAGECLHCPRNVLGGAS